MFLFSVFAIPLPFSQILSKFPVSANILHIISCLMWILRISLTSPLFLFRNIKEHSNYKKPNGLRECHGGPFLSRFADFLCQ